MKSKYFIPQDSDIHLGYECEINSFSVNGKDEWYPYIVGEDYEHITIARAIAETKRGKRGIRVPYLTKEIIQAEVKNGFELYVPPARDLFNMYEGVVLVKDNYWYTFQIIEKHWYLSIVPRDPSTTPLTRHEPPVCMILCKDINTFRYLAKLINNGK